ncbi:MAG TPA: hypothetical protein VFC44_17615, partial [Candidatus Saccharimonadales bacterium]|nr:hypothetical protein [Candidatus Saccharimonadales bacterium]
MWTEGTAAQATTAAEQWWSESLFSAALTGGVTLMSIVIVDLKVARPRMAAGDAVDAVEEG